MNKQSKNSVIVRAADGSYKGIVWNLTLETKQDKIDFEINLPKSTAARLCLLTQTVDEECCNPLKVWHELGEPANLNDAQIELLKSAAKPLVKTQVLKGAAPKFTLSASRNAVIYFELAPAPLTSDNAYDYGFYEKM